MKNGILDIKTFLLLDAIRSKHDVKDKDWVKAAGLGHTPRISELRHSAKGTRQVADRAFHYKKWVALKRGLETILGGEIVRKDLAELLENTKDIDEKLVLILTAIPDDRKKEVLSYLELVAQAPPKKPIKPVSESK